MPNKVRLREQIQRNAVALISLVVAVTSLGYNTWRNEASEHNRNQRLVSIEVLRNVGELQQVVYYRHWESDAEDKGNPLTGWALVLTIKDLAQVLGGEVLTSGIRLWEVWQKDWEGLGPDRDSYDRIIDALDTVRADTNALLQSLD